MNPYDEIHYPSHVFRQTHPDRLATIATLRGLDPAPPGACRMLDLGCGAGMNVIACAAAAPRSEFVGVDLAAAPVARGNETAAKAGLKNVRLLVGDVSVPDPAWGTFDYVVSHGVYSWVPAPVREKLLATVAACLRPGGVGYVSYIAFPGATAQQMFRDVMVRHASAATTAEEKVRQSQELLRFLAAGRTRKGEPWDDWLRAEVAQRLSAAPGYLRHDDLEETRDPVWFHEFAEHAERHGLRVLGEADWKEDSDAGCAPEVRAVLDKIDDPVAREQYRDLLKFRRFRQTLVVHRSATPSPKPCVDRIERLLVACEVKPPEQPVPLDRSETETVQGPHGASASTNSRIGRAALRVLADAWPRPTAFADLLAEASRRVAEARGGAAPEEDERATLLTIVAAMHDVGVMNLHAVSPAVAVSAGRRPLASPLVRLLAQQGERVISLHQRSINIDDARARRLLAMLDGSVARPEMVRRLRAAEAPPHAPPEGAPPITEDLVERALALFAREGFLLR